MSLKGHYQRRYGAWAGNPNGLPPDFSRCCETVQSDHVSRQCGKRNGHGPDGAYCKTHDPDAVKRRREASNYLFHKKYYDGTIRGLRGADKILKAIAEGHNDPRALAQEWLDKMGDKLVEPKPPAAHGGE